MINRRSITSKLACLQLEARAEGEPPTISGYAAVYYDGTRDTEFKLWKGVYERIMPGAFDRAIRDKHDARGLFNHNPDLILGRRSAGTVTLAVDKRGLKFTISPADTNTYRDVVGFIRRGEVDGASFAFSEATYTWKEEEDRDVREITDLRLWDVGPVTYPAYEATEVGIKSAFGGDEAAESYKQWMQQRIEDEQRRSRLRLITCGG